MIQTRVAGIPCQAEMTAGYYQKPDPSTWDSDLDYHGGWFDVDFKIYDRGGKEAPWLDKKLTPADQVRIINELTINAGGGDGDF